AGVMLDRMGDMLKYSAHAALVLNSTKGRPGDQTAPIKPVWEQLASSSTAPADRLSWLRRPLRALQRATKETMLAFILIGAAAVTVASRQRMLLLMMVPLYYLLFQSFMHTEFRYTLPMQYFLFVLAATVWVLLGYAISHCVKSIGLRLWRV